MSNPGQSPWPAVPPTDAPRAQQQPGLRPLAPAQPNHLAYTQPVPTASPSQQQGLQQPQQLAHQAPQFAGSYPVTRDPSNSIAGFQSSFAPPSQYHSIQQPQQLAGSYSVPQDPPNSNAGIQSSFAHLPQGQSLQQPRPLAYQGQHPGSSYTLQAQPNAQQNTAPIPRQYSNQQLPPSSYNAAQHPGPRQLAPVQPHYHPTILTSSIPQQPNLQQSQARDQPPLNAGSFHLGIGNQSSRANTQNPWAQPAMSVYQAPPGRAPPPVGGLTRTFGEPGDLFAPRPLHYGPPPPPPPRVRAATTLPHAPVSVVSSMPGYDPKAVGVNGNVQVSKNIKEVTFAAVPSPETCMVCKVPFGLENPHGAYFENIRQLGGATLKVEINNLGAIETRTYLPCAHEIGNNCAYPYIFCPQCKASLHYPDCPHKIPQTHVKRTKKDAEKKCVECRVTDYEHAEDLAGLLADLKMRKEWRGENGVIDIQSRIDEIKAKTDNMIEEAQYKVAGYL